MSVGFCLFFRSVSVRIQQNDCTNFRRLRAISSLATGWNSTGFNYPHIFLLRGTCVCCSAYALRPQEKKSICEWNSRNQLNSILVVCLRSVCWMADQYYHKLSAEHQFTFYTFRRAHRLRRRFGERMKKKKKEKKRNNRSLCLCILSE